MTKRQSLLSIAVGLLLSTGLSCDERVQGLSATETQAKPVVVDDGKGLQLEIEHPYPFNFYSIVTIKAGEALEVIGSAHGASFKSYRVESAPGQFPPQVWSAAGVVLEGGGTSPVSSGLLARWTPPAGTLGVYSIRVVGSNGADETIAKTTVYVEPDLVTSKWPQYLGDVAWGVVPARAADGKVWLVTCGYPSAQGTTTCDSISSDGASHKSMAVSRGTELPFPAGNVDSKPGDEIVILDGDRLRVLSADLTPVIDIAPVGPRAFRPYRTFLADLDNDGVFEIVSMTWAPGRGLELHVHRGNGQVFGSNYPVTVAKDDPVEGITYAGAVVVDLNQDGAKGIVLLGSRSDKNAMLLVYNRDGTPLVGRPRPSFLAPGGADGLRAVDLDHDGRPEFIWQEALSQNGVRQVRVVDSEGVTRPGFPTSLVSFVTAFADLDRDGKDEIIARSNLDSTLKVIRADGTPFGPSSWPINHNYGVVAAADVDGDGYPEILVSETPSFDGTIWLRALSHTGTVARSWHLFGMNGQPASGLGVTVGDTTGDGVLDLGLLVPLKDNVTGYITKGAVSVLNLNKPFVPAHLDWPNPFADPQNSNVRMVAAQPPLPSVDASATTDARADAALPSPDVPVSPADAGARDAPATMVSDAVAVDERTPFDAGSVVDVAQAADAGNGDVPLVADAGNGDVPPVADAGSDDGPLVADAPNVTDAAAQDAADAEVRADTIGPEAGDGTAEPPGCNCSVSARRDASPGAAMAMMAMVGIGLLTRARRRHRRQ